VQECDEAHPGVMGGSGLNMILMGMCNTQTGYKLMLYLVGYNPSDLHGISRFNPLITGVN